MESIEGINEPPQGKIAMTNHENFMKADQRKQLTAEQAQKKQLPYETTAGQTDAQRELLRKHQING